jgi:hypothetical protein
MRHVYQAESTLASAVDDASSIVVDDATHDDAVRGSSSARNRSAP